VLAFKRAWLEALVLATLIGAMTRTLWSPGTRWLGGIKFSAKTLLEVAILLLGCSLSAQIVTAVGPGLLGESPLSCAPQSLFIAQMVTTKQSRIRLRSLKEPMFLRCATSLPDSCSMDRGASTPAPRARTSRRGALAGRRHVRLVLVDHQVQ
jgi:hypothetical protein